MRNELVPYPYYFQMIGWNWKVNGYLLLSVYPTPRNSRIKGSFDCKKESTFPSN